jgi:hypothetical protein
MKRIAFLITLICIAFLSVGCASYKPDSLARLNPEFAPYVEEIEGVTVAARKFTTQDSKSYLDRDVIVKGYQPVQLAIDNRSTKTFLFSTSGVSLPCARPDDVARKVHTSTVGRVFAWGIPGLIIWPLIIPAIVDGIGSSNANSELDKDFSAKALNEVVVQPASFVEGLLFIPTESFVENFQVKLVDRDTKKVLEFNVEAH